MDVEFTVLDTEFQVRPKDFIHDLRAHLPAKYSPLTSSGNGLQSVYLAAVPESLASRLLSLAGPEATALVAAARDSDPQALRERSEDRLIQFIKLTPLGETVKQALVAARRGQGRFRNGVQLVEPRCRITGVSNPEILTASHIRPWNRCADHSQRLDPFNGLLLTPTFDRLFDRGLMSFGNRGQILVSRDLAPIDAQRIGLDPDRNVGAFRQEQLPYLEYHRDLIFRQ